jgi:hypothetical protein
MWERWDARAIAADLDAVREMGLNTVRFFLVWRNFEPAPGEPDARQFNRLAWFLGECARRELFAQPSLFVGWMSGGVFWPEWKKNRNLFSDPFMARHAEAFARRAAAALAPFREHIPAIDLGNELGCLEDSQQADRASVGAWCARISSAIKDELPGMLVVSGCDHGQVVNDSPWSFDNQPGTDFLSMHAYPVANWHPAPLAGLADPLTRELFPFYCAYARAHGPTLFQEFGSYLTTDPVRVADYLAEVLPAVAATGVNGMLWWCLNDFSAREHPYALCAQERELGLRDLRGRLKPGLADAIGMLAGWAADPASLPSVEPADFVILVPALISSLAPEYLPPPNVQPVVGRRALAAWHLARLAGLHPGFAPASRLPSPGAATVLVAGCALSPREQSLLLDWAAAGGHLLLHGMHCRDWGEDFARAVGARVIDYALNTTRSTTLHDESWNFPPIPSEARHVVEVFDADTLAYDQDDLPLLFTRDIGRGQITVCLASPEDAALHDRSQSVAAGDRWSRWLSAEVTSLALS